LELRQGVLLRLAGNALNAMLDGLIQTDEETRDRIMRMCGEACAREEHWGPATEIAERISRGEKDLDRILERANSEISWCGKWVKVEDRIQSTCRECGCPLVRHGVVRNTGVFCHCSKGWVETTFGALLKRPVKVELEKALGLGDDECRYIVHLGEADLQ
jgi:hypothetical protein